MLQAFDLFLKEELTVDLPPLTSPYREYAEQGQWDRYIASLAQDGVLWCLNYDIPSLAAHLMPLQNLADPSVIPTRIAMLGRVCQPETEPESLDAFFGEFMDQKDVDAAACTASAAVLMVYNQGRHFSRFEDWENRLMGILKVDSALSPSALASAVSLCGFVEALYRGNHDQASPIMRKGIGLAKTANAMGIYLFHSIHLGYCYLMAGDFALLDMLMAEIAGPCSLPDMPPFFTAHYNGLLGIYKAFKGEISEGKEILLKIFRHPLFDGLPTGTWLYIASHLIFAAVRDNDRRLVDDMLARIQHRAIPEGNHYNHGYLHFNLALIHFTRGVPERAMRHIQECIDRRPLVEAEAALAHPLLLKGQILSELGDDARTVAYFNSHIPVWTHRHYFLFSSTGFFELARVHRRRGDSEDARHYFESGIKVLPSPDHPLVLHRSATFLMDLKKDLFPEGDRPILSADFGARRIHISAFGSLRLALDGQPVYDRQWKGNKSRLLLKALIVFGPANVPMDLLAELLWPDGDAKAAINRLRVTLSRLRKVVQSETGPELDWIVVKQRKVSLVDALCMVDAHRFREGLARSLREKNADLMMETLDLYRDDLLVDDINEAWIIQRRESLKREFVKGVLFLAESEWGEAKTETVIPYLENALERDPCNEDLHAALMSAHLKTGNGARAVQVYGRAKDALADLMGKAPGAELDALHSKARGRN